MILQSIPNFKAKYPDRYGDVLDAIQRKLDGEQKGIPITAPTLKVWIKLLESSAAA
jgi:hypothetical protein